MVNCSSASQNKWNNHRKEPFQLSLFHLPVQSTKPFSGHFLSDITKKTGFQPSLTRTYSLSNLIGKRIRLNPSSPDPHLFDWKWAIKRPATNHFEEKRTLFRKRLIGTRSIPIERNWLLQRQRRKNGLVRKANRITVRTKSWLVPAGIHSNTIDKDPRWRKQGRLLAWF